MSSDMLGNIRHLWQHLNRCQRHEMPSQETSIRLSTSYSLQSFINKINLESD